MSELFVIGLTGKSGCGKSTVCGMLVKKGRQIIDCDALARQVQQKGTTCLAELTAEFGERILLHDGSLNRRLLGEICFGDDEKKARLNAICHPHILSLLRDELSRLRGAVIVEAAALFESGLERECDKVVVVACSEDNSVSRLVIRDGISEAHAKERLWAQYEGAELEKADYIIHNGGTLAELEKAVDELDEIIKQWTGEGNLMGEKTKAQVLSEKLLVKRKSCFEMYDDKRLEAAREYAVGYMAFLDSSKTEREAVITGVAMLEKQGFKPFDSKKTYKAGDRIYLNNRGKALIAAVVGSENIEKGVNIIAAHVDSPRLDLKANPLYEDNEVAYLKTHYYGGIKKYQWTAIPLALHGVVIDAEGKTINVNIGEDESDPVLYITNLLPHLSASHSTRTSREVVKGEELNAIIATVPFDTDKETKDAVKLNAMRLLNEKYGFTEADFVSAELELVPALKCRFVGLDKSLIASYGHDDRVCAYPALTALLELKNPKSTNMCIFADKEETGSDGATGMQGEFLKNFITQLVHSVDANADSLVVFGNSRCISSDVTAALDPVYPEVMEKRNASFLNYGPSLDKYGGSGGKYGCNDATAEFVGKMRRMLDAKEICWQTGELGKVDEGGGGTVAKYIAVLDIDVVDCGVPMLSMHSPYELASVYDVYSFYLCCGEFFKL